MDHAIPKDLAANYTLAKDSAFGLGGTIEVVYSMVDGERES
jgi:hypothetical protein